MSSPLDVIVVGPLNIDLIVAGTAPREIDALQDWFGLSEVTINVAGAAGYPAQVFQKLGLRTGVLSVLADDMLGDALRRGLSDLGIDLSRTRTATGKLTAIAIYLLLFGGKKRPLTGRHSTYQPWPNPLDADDLRYLESARLIHVAGYLHYPAMWNDDIPNMLRQAHERGQMTSLDPQFPLDPISSRWLTSIEPLLPYVDVLLADQDELQNISGLEDLDASANLLQEAGLPGLTIAVKRGARGCRIYQADQCFDQATFAVPDNDIADTIGTGDAFDAGFLAALLRGRPAADAARIGSATATISMRGHGAASALTPQDTIDALIRQYASD